MKSSYQSCEEDPNCTNLIPESSKQGPKKRSTSDGGVLDYGPSVPLQQVKKEAANAKKAVNIVDKMLKDGIISPPVKDYILRSVQFDPRKVTKNGLPVYGLFVPTSNIINEGKIFLFLDGAATLKDSIETYGHELGHFNLDWTHNKIESYGQSIYKKYEETKK